MSEKQWLGASNVLDQLRVAGDLWMCPRCRSFGHSDHRQYISSFAEFFTEDCSYCERSSKRRVLTPRKQRLLACGACRFLGDELTGEPALRAVEAAEHYADGLITRSALGAARERATAPAARAAGLPHSWEAAARATELALARLGELHESRIAVQLHAELTQVLTNAQALCGKVSGSAAKRYRRHREQRIRTHFAELVNRAKAEDARALTEVPRDILGDPFHPVRLELNWLLADDSRVRKVARAIYDSGRFDEMPVLADALQDAGYSDARLLDHCLQDRHYRGCWLLDAVLGKE